MYGHKYETTNTAEYKFYSSRQGRLEAEAIPPCSDSLKLHTSRENYQFLFAEVVCSDTHMYLLLMAMAGS